MKNTHFEFADDRAQDSFKSFKKRIYLEIRNRGMSQNAGIFLWVKATLLFAVALCSYCLLILSPVNGLEALLCGGVFGIAILMFALNVSHDAAHGSFSKSRRINRMLLFIPFAILGVDPKMWRARHINSHHRFPNLDNCDADIDENLFIRLSPHQKKRVWHRFQHYYAWLLYCVVAFHAVWIQDINYMRRSSLANMSDWQIRIPAWSQFLMTKMVHVCLVLALPLFFLQFAWFQIIAGIVLIQGILSLLFILPLIGTHFSSAAVFPETNNGKMSHSYVTHQILTSVDWQPFSRAANEFIGGLNAHSAHHLFPQVSHTHYRWISSEISQFCYENGLRHNIVNLRQAVRNHYEFLRQLALT